MRVSKLRHWAGTVSLAISMALAVVAPTQAADEDTLWRVRLDFSWVDPSGDFVSTNIGGGTVETSFDTGFGGGVRGEYLLSSRFGVELGVLSAASVDVGSGILGDTTGNAVEVSGFTPLSIGLNVHLTTGSPLDLYVGPQLVLVNYSDVDVRTTVGGGTTVSLSVDSDTGWGAILGIDVPIGDGAWLVQANLRYLQTDIDGSEGAISINSEFDPVILSLGFGYRF